MRALLDRTALQTTCQLVEMIVLKYPTQTLSAIGQLTFISEKPHPAIKPGRQGFPFPLWYSNDMSFIHDVSEMILFASVGLGIWGEFPWGCLPEPLPSSGVPSGVLG